MKRCIFLLILCISSCNTGPYPKPTDAKIATVQWDKSPDGMNIHDFDCDCCKEITK